MRGRFGLFLATVLGLFIVCLPVSAHHGGAAYDTKTTLTLKATITSFRFINPHVQISFDATDDKGTVVHWECESPVDPAMASRQGWTRNSLKPGDQVTIVGRPAKSGAKVLSLSKVIFADGHELGNRIPN